MTVSMQVCKRTYQGNGETRLWEVDFPLLSPADLRVVLTSPQGEEEELSQDFELSPDKTTLQYPTQASGKAALAEGWSITLIRCTPATQQIDLLRQGELDAEVLEQGYDKLTLLVQELGEQVGRSIKYPVCGQETQTDAAEFLATVLQNKEQASCASTQAALSAQQARSSADGAQASALAAEASSRTAGQQAQAASSCASAAAQSAQEAATNKTAAQQSAAAAGAQAEAAAASALAAQELVDEEASARQAATAALQTALNAKQDTISDLAAIRSGAQAGSTALQPSAAAATYVALSQKAAAGGVASLDNAGKITDGQIPYATSSKVGGIKQSFDATTGTWTVITEDA